jgi:hypothetical protein
LFDQGLQLLPRLGTILHCGTNLVEKVQSLVNLALGIGRVGALLGRHGLTLDASIAGVIVAVYGAIAIARATGRIALRTGETVAHRTRLAAAGSTCLLLAAGTLAAGLTCLLLAAGTLAATLTTLTGLAALLARLALLPRLAVLRLPLSGLTGWPVAGELLGLELLAAGLAGKAGLTLSRLRGGTSTEAGDLVAQTG